MRKTWIKLIIIIPAAILLFRYVQENIIADKCLDSGGSVNYGTYECDMLNSHTYIPFSKRHPIIFFTGITTAVVAAGLVIVSAGDESSKEQRDKA